MHIGGTYKSRFSKSCSPGAKKPFNVSFFQQRSTKISRCLTMLSLVPHITPTLLGVPLRSVCGLVGPSARLQWGYGGAEGWSAAYEQRFSSTFFYFRKSSTQPRRSAVNTVWKHFPSSCGLPAAFRMRCARLLTLCSRPAALQTRCVCINMPGQSFVLLFFNAAA